MLRPEARMWRYRGWRGGGGARTRPQWAQWNKTSQLDQIEIRTRWHSKFVALGPYQSVKHCCQACIICMWNKMFYRLATQLQNNALQTFFACIKQKCFWTFLKTFCSEHAYFCLSSRCDQTFKHCLISKNVWQTMFFIIWSLRQVWPS